MAVTTAGQASAADVATEVAEATSAAAELVVATAAPDPVAATPATAAEISSAVASSTRRFSLKIHPGSSSAVSQV